MNKKKDESFNLLKLIKINESTLSTILGAAVVLVVGVLIFNYFKSSKPSQISPEAEQEEKEITIEEGKETPLATLPTKHKVAQGEYLWQIAEKYYGSGYNWIDIAQENRLINPDLLFVDQELSIPKVEVRKLATETKEVVDKITDDKYQVKKGDNLWSIAVRAYSDGYKWPEIAKANNLNNPNYLEVGQELKLPR